MQKLMQALASQQAYPMANLSDPPHPTSPPSSSNPPYPTSSTPTSQSQVMMYDPNAYDLSRFHNGATDSNIAGPMLSTLGSYLQREEDTTATSLEPLLDNATRLQKSYQDASDIESDVDALQLSINSLIEGLGLDPNTIVNDHPPHDEHPGLHEPNASGFPNAGGSTNGPSSSSLANDGSTSTSPVLEPISADPAPEFDFENFFNELSARGANGLQYPDMTSSFADSDGIPLSNLPVNGNDTDTNPEQLAAFLDEVSSDASTTGPIVEEITAATTAKGKKRKSDVIELPPSLGKSNPVESGEASPKVKRKR